MDAHAIALTFGMDGKLVNTAANPHRLKRSCTIALHTFATSPHRFKRSCTTDCLHATIDSNNKKEINEMLIHKMDNHSLTVLAQSEKWHLISKWIDILIHPYINYYMDKRKASARINCRKNWWNHQRNYKTHLKEHFAMIGWSESDKTYLQHHPISNMDDL